MSNETVLQVIEKAASKGALICFDKTNGFPQVELYRVEVTEMTIDKVNDCYFINKKYMPNKNTVCRIGEASGVIFTTGETTVQTISDPSCGEHQIYIGTAQGKVRMPDGTWRMSSICYYEFDPTLRAMLDYDVMDLTPETKTKKKKDYGPNLATAIKEYQKSARQRASTGAMLRVIRELVGLPIALTEEQVSHLFQSYQTPHRAAIVRVSTACIMCGISQGAHGYLKKNTKLVVINNATKNTVNAGRNTHDNSSSFNFIRQSTPAH